MFTSSVRRAICTVPSTTPIVPTTASCISSRAISMEALSRSRSRNQRRFSSSKPSNPSGGSHGLSQGDKEASIRSQKAESRDKEAKDKTPKEVAEACTVKGRDESLQNLPSVPSTQHLKPNDVTASAFFSLYRPISITSSFPKPVTTEAFASIFTPQDQNQNTYSSEVISRVKQTLSNTVRKLELNADPDIQQLETQNDRLFDTQNDRMKFPRHIMSGRNYQPFNPPPPPVPMSTEQSLAAGFEAAEEAAQNSHRTYTALLTVEERTDEHGQLTYTAHSSPLVDVAEQVDVVAPSFRERMMERQERYEEYREQRAEKSGIWAISVKRQRRLKMKKHKFKKLMKRTRNLRRRLERT